MLVDRFVQRLLELDPANAAVNQGDPSVEANAAGKAQCHVISGRDQPVAQIEQAAHLRQVVRAANPVVPAHAAIDREAHRTAGAARVHARTPLSNGGGARLARRAIRACRRKVCRSRSSRCHSS